MIIGEEYITCRRCGYMFERDKFNKHCSNCVVCTGCEIYYCPSCDEEIIITPIRPMRSSSNEKEGEGGGGS